MERLPLLGSKAHEAWCKRADKNLRHEKLEPGKFRLPPIYPDGAKERALALYATDEFSMQSVADQVAKEFGCQIPKSAVYGWVTKQRKENANAKPQN